MTFEFNNKQKKLVAEYHEIVTYGYKKLCSVSLDLNRTRVRKKILYFMMGAMQSYSESNLKLMSSKPAYEKPGESLLRSQLEIWLNLRFIYSSRSEDKARLFLSDLVIESIKYATNHKTLWEKYPSWNLEFGKIKKSDDWDKFIFENTKLLKKSQKKHKDKPVMKLPNLYARTIAIDKYLEKLGTLSENTSAEKYYTLFYPYFSQSTHANMSGLLRYMSGTAVSPDPFFYIDSKPEDAEKVLTISYVAYFDVLRFFLQVFGVYNAAEYKRFKLYSKEMMKE
ncbi:MAG TPA: DUF5677 domain-containing protein [Candidatus Woesebacteria bacterium]|nr:DUF5677 domain-containing protein [Candidatus Woesebacteria bacterium]